jgi:hypothetical protein
MASIPTAQLEALIEHATVDCYNDSEQVCGLFTLLEQSLAVPFETTVLGEVVTVTAVDLSIDDRIVAVCMRNGARQRVPLLDLPIPTPPPPPGAEWIEAYRHWATRTGRDVTG